MNPMWTQWMKVGRSITESLPTHVTIHWGMKNESKQIKDFLILKGEKTTVYPNLRDTMYVVLTGKFIVLIGK